MYLIFSKVFYYLILQAQAFTPYLKSRLRSSLQCRKSLARIHVILSVKFLLCFTFQTPRFCVSGTLKYAKRRDEGKRSKIEAIGHAHIKYYNEHSSCCTHLLLPEELSLTALAEKKGTLSRYHSCRNNAILRRGTISFVCSRHAHDSISLFK